MTSQGPSTSDSLEQIRSEYVEKTQKAKYNNMLASCTPLEQEMIKMLSEVDKMSGGNLNRLVSIYNTIKQSS
ncbi:MAG: hypothetical protein AAGE84_23385 [Cyanobacteria bacterium P01_G01_bin.39]